MHRLGTHRLGKGWGWNRSASSPNPPCPTSTLPTAGTPPSSAATPTRTRWSGLLEWHFSDDAGVQLWRDPARAGSSTTVVEVADLDDELARLDAVGIAHDAPMSTPRATGWSSLEDPDRNRRDPHRRLSAGPCQKGPREESGARLSTRAKRTRVRPSARRFFSRWAAGHGSTAPPVPRYSEPGGLAPHPGGESAVPDLGAAHESPYHQRLRPVRAPRQGRSGARRATMRHFARSPNASTGRSRRTSARGAARHRADGPRRSTATWRSTGSARGCGCCAGSASTCASDAWSARTGEPSTSAGSRWPTRRRTRCCSAGARRRPSRSSPRPAHVRWA